MRLCNEKRKQKHINKGSWSKQEDEKLINHIKKYGEGSCSWTTLPHQAGLQRCGKSCRLRWVNYLRPDIKHGNFSIYEEDLIIKLHALLGNRWSLIAGRLPGRTDNEVKNYWNTRIKRKLIRAGFDPNNHRIHQNYIQNNYNKSNTSNININMNVKNGEEEDQVSSSSSSSFHFQTEVVRPRPYIAPTPDAYI